MSEITKGKKYRTDNFPAKTTVEEIKEQQEEQKKYDHPDAVPLETYCAMKGIRDIPTMEGMRAYTKIKRAQVVDWDKIFEGF